MVFRDRVKSLRRVRSGDLMTNPKNYRTHPPEQSAALRGVLSEVGYAGAVVARETPDGLELIDGHLRAELDPEQKIPVLVVDVSGKEADKLLATFDPLSMMAGTDAEALAKLLDGMEFDEASTQSMVDALGDGLPDQADDLEAPEPEPPPAEPITKEGDLIKLGRHRLLCGDTTDAAAVVKLTNNQELVLIHADPPYGMGKEADGIKNDNLYRDKLDAFQLSWWTAWRPTLSDNASAYIWGNAADLWRFWYGAGLGNSEPLTFRNEVVWDKGNQGDGRNGNGLRTEAGRMYQRSERCLFFMLGVQGFNTNAEHYWEGWEPIREYLDIERRRLKWSHEHVAKFFGFSSRMPYHWFTKSQFVFIRQEHYERLQEEAGGAGFKKGYQALSLEYELLKVEFEKVKAEFYKSRPYFDNQHDTMTDVWTFPRVTGDDRHGHATPKPVAMAARAIKSSTLEGAAVGVPFAGTCPEIIAAEQLGRTVFAMETDPSYCDVIVQRWEKLTNGKAHRQK